MYFVCFVVPIPDLLLSGAVIGSTGIPVVSRLEPSADACDFFAAMLPNSHHLELFYFVARHGGIKAALRHMPYLLDPSGHHQTVESVWHRSL